jgi:hypothetical protein
MLTAPTAPTKSRRDIFRSHLGLRSSAPLSTRGTSRGICLVCILFVSQLFAPVVFAQAAVERKEQSRSNAFNAPPPVPATPPPVPSNRPSIQLFRELLDASPAERLKLLTNYSSESQKLLLAKVREYEKLDLDERTLRLRATELRYYLSRLMNLPATNRTARLREVPEELRQPVDDRLRKWDLLPPELQKELLENQAFLAVFQESGGNPLSVTNMSPARAQQLQRGLEHWRELPQDQRQRIIDGFNQYLTLTPRERDKVLGTLSDAERQRIERTLLVFKNLTPEQRSRCLHSLDKFAWLTPDERRQFLKNADRWKAMTPAERQNWRKLVETLSLEPPLPDTDTPLPPVPRPRPPQRSASPPSLATNQP